MNLKDFISKIANIENSIDISQLKIYDFNPWPFIRLAILRKYSTEEKATINVTRNSSYFRKFKFLLHSFFLYSRNPVKSEKVDIIYFTRTSENRSLNHDKTLNIYFDTLSYCIENRYRMKVLEMIDQINDKIYKKPNKEIVYIDFLIKLEYIRNMIVSRLFRRRNVSFQKLHKEIQNEFGFSVAFEDNLTYINLLSLRFIKILQQYQPKLVFLTVFYREEAMAMVLACHRLGIKVVEYQHGAQNDYHAMYTHWSNIPQKGYEIIPDIFWMWGAVPKERIDKWSENTNKHEAIIGGNIWMTYCRNNYTYSSDITKIYSKDKKHVLISLQGDNFFPDFLIPAIEKSSKNMFWHFRDHPRLPISKKLKQKLLTLSNVEIEFSTREPLYLLLEIADVHITGYSTVAFEAQSFNVPTIFTHTNAKDGYNGLLNKNGLFYVDDTEKLLSVMKKLLLHQEKIQPEYIVSDSKLHKNILEFLLNREK